MRIVAISDTHGFHRTVNIPRDGDVLVHSGDFSVTGYKMSEYNDFVDWFSAQEHEYKVLIAGNHELLLDSRFGKRKHEYSTKEIFQKNSQEKRDFIVEYMKSKGITYLENSSETIEGIKFYGTPVGPIFYDWAFNEKDFIREKLFSKIDEDVQVLLCHTPPFNTGGLDAAIDYLDRTKPNLPVGDKILRERIEYLSNHELKKVFCGHIHEGYGNSEINGVEIFNTAICNVYYEPNNLPRVVEL